MMIIKITNFYNYLGGIQYNQVQHNLHFDYTN